MGNGYGAALRLDHPAARRQALVTPRHRAAVPAGQEGGIRKKLLRAWPLCSILTAQVVLTWPWLGRTAAFTDEALYLEAGHGEWAHWLRQVPVPNYGAWFSGAPVIYPPLGAAADSAGGLEVARGLSLVLMLMATVAVYLAGRRLFGHVAAIFASSLFAVSGLIVHYGAFATYNPLALTCLALALWAGVRVRDGGRGWFAATAILMVMSNAAKYATLAWDPVVLSVIVFHDWWRGIACALRRALSVAAMVAVMEIGLLMLGGPGYVRGLSVTTVFRHVESGLSSPSAVLWRSFMVTGILVLPGILGVLVSALRRNPVYVTGLLGCLVLAALVAPIDQAHIREISSLDKNLGFGYPFVALAAGYAVSAAMHWAGERHRAGMVAVGVLGACVVLTTVVAGRVQRVQFIGASKLAASQIVSAVDEGYHQGTYILSDGAPWVEKYYLPSIPSHAWVGIFRPPPAQRARVRKRMCTGQISVVILRVRRHSYFRPYDYQLYRMMQETGHYKLAIATRQGKDSTQVWEDSSSSRINTCG